MRILLFLCIALTIRSTAQTLVPYQEKTDFCDTTKAAKLIGAFAKIYHGDEIYDSANHWKGFYFPTSEMQVKGG